VRFASVLRTKANSSYPRNCKKKQPYSQHGTDHGDHPITRDHPIVLPSTPRTHIQGHWLNAEKVKKKSLRSRSHFLSGGFRNLAGEQAGPKTKMSRGLNAEC
jgi:hypothetical protein